MPFTMDEKGNASVTCDCGKPIVIADKYGMFCEDLCGYEESKKAALVISQTIDRLSELFK